MKKMKRKIIESSSYNARTSKKKYKKDIFMPQFFLDLIQLTKKAQKFHRKINRPANPDLVLDFQTSFSHMPKLNCFSCKDNCDKNNESNKKKEKEKEKENKRLKLLSLMNSPERVIIRPNLPLINDKTYSTSIDNKKQNSKNNLINIINNRFSLNNKNKEESSSNSFGIKINQPQIKFNRNKSFISINFNMTKSLLSSITIGKVNQFKLNNKNNNDTILNSSNIRPLHVHKKNKNNLLLSNFLELHVKNKLNNKNKKISKENKKNNNNLNINNTNNNINNNTNTNANESFLKKESKRKIVNINFNKMSNNNNNYNSSSTNSNNTNNNINTINNLSLKKISHLPKSYKTKEDLNSDLNYINSSNNIDYSYIINPILNTTPNIYYYNINKMYRKQMIEYMNHRINWKYIDYNILNNLENNSSQKNIFTINFEWRYYSNKINYKKFRYIPNTPNKKLKMVNLFEKNYEIGNKKNMFLNLISYCDKIKYNIFEIVPFTMILSNTKEIESATNSLKEIIELLENNKNNKNNLIINKLYKEQFFYDKNYENLNNQIIYFDKNFLSDKNNWILKPTDMYQGKYIEISNTFEDIYRKCINMFKGVNSNLAKEIMEIEEENQKNELNSSIINNNSSKYNDNLKKRLILQKTVISKMYCCSDIIIQKYLDNPFLYKKRKFDIRCFVLLDSNLNLYYCKEGHLKGSSELYNVENRNKFIHITNYSFQKMSSGFARYEYGNEISYKNFKLFLEEEGFPLEKFNLMIEEMKFLIKISFKSVSKKIIKTSDVLCFELFGYDFILDNEFKPWILEINNNPGLGISSPVIEKIIPRMMDDAFRLTIDKVFETKYDENCFDENGNYKSRFPIEGYRNDENIFEFLCNIK